MKKLLLALALCLVGSLQAQETIVYNLDTSVTNNFVSATTNSTPATVEIINNPKDTIRIYVTASGLASTTNGSFIIKFSTSTGTSSVTNEFDTASLSNIKITMSSLGLTTNTVSDWFQVRGVRYIRVGSMENTFLGPVSNITVRVATVSGGQQ